jgi:ankyrin repeat-rich membrane spanning protein
VSPTDKNGDNVLHISLRNRSKEITELILANPKNSKFLYKPNKQGETPHKIDASNPKSILTQIFGARQLNMTEDSILGYDLYSSALSEILSEPSLHTPITVGLYAKWGSGKSFLLNQLKAEMKSFARLTRVVYLKADLFLLLTVLLLSLLVATPLLFYKWPIGLGVLGSVLGVTFLVIGVSKFCHERKEQEWAERICNRLSIQVSRFKLLLQVLFLNPYVTKTANTEHKNLRFIFTDYGKISTIGGENALALMVSGLCTKMEDQLGLVVTRLCRVFYNKTHSNDKFKKFCCIPTFILVSDAC